MQVIEEILPEHEHLRLVSRRHAAELMDCTPQHIYHLIESGDLEPVRIGPKAVRITLTSLKQFIGR